MSILHVRPIRALDKFLLMVNFPLNLQLRLSSDTVLILGFEKGMFLSRLGHSGGKNGGTILAYNVSLLNALGGGMNCLELNSYRNWPRNIGWFRNILEFSIIKTPSNRSIRVLFRLKC